MKHVMKGFMQGKQGQNGVHGFSCPIEICGKLCITAGRKDSNRFRESKNNVGEKEGVFPVQSPANHDRCQGEQKPATHDRQQYVE